MSKRKILIVLVIGIVITCIIIPVYAMKITELKTITKMTNRNENNEINAKKTPQEVEYNKSQLENELNSDKKVFDENYKKEKQIEDNNDEKAGIILNKYHKKVIVMTNDKYEDYKTMQTIVDLIKSNNLSEGDIFILKNYLRRRVAYIDDNEELKNNILDMLK